MKRTAYIAGSLGLVLFVALMIHADSQDILRVCAAAGWRLLWLLPYRAVYFLLYAAGWYWLLLAAAQLPSVRFGPVFWLTGLREAIDRLLPVASVGGALVAVRILGWRGIGRVRAGATIVVEILLTLWVSYAFAAFGWVMWVLTAPDGGGDRHVWYAVLMTLPVPVSLMLLLRHGGLFHRLHRHMAPLLGMQERWDGVQALDGVVRRLVRRPDTWIVAGGLQFLALLSGAVEIWLLLRWFGQPVDLSHAVMLEAATQAVRHVAFFVPAALGVQEAGLVAFGHLVGVGPELALAVSIAKRAREIACGLPYLARWQWLELQHVRDSVAHGTQS